MLGGIGAYAALSRQEKQVSIVTDTPAQSVSSAPIATTIAPAAAATVSTSPTKSPTQTSQPKKLAWRTYRMMDPSYAHWEVMLPANLVCSESHLSSCRDRFEQKDKDIIVLSYSEISQCTEDFMDDVEPIPATYCVGIGDAEKWSSTDPFGVYIQKTYASYDEKDGKVLRIHDAVTLNGSTMVKVEATIKGIPIDMYLFEKDKTAYYKILVVKHKPAEAAKRSAEIDTIIRSFKFI